MSIDQKIKKLFSKYEKAFSGIQVEKQIPLFAENFISAGPSGSSAISREEFIKISDETADIYRRAGQTEAKIFSLEEIPITDEYSMVLIHWGAKFKKTGSK